jgi:PadR family transcriptional regulator, regulatory protein PadR
MPKNGLQITLTILRIATLFADDPKRGLWNYAISKRLLIKANTSVLILGRMERAGWITSDWEKPQAVAVGRPRRRIYRITDFGVSETARALSELKP